MQTKLSAFCERIMEAGWLSALIIEPLFFNVYSDRVFEPDKIALLRSIALILIAAWVVKLIEDHARPTTSADAPAQSLWQRLTRVPLVLPTLLLVAVYLFSTITSVTPRASLWGSYQRLQGTYSTLSYIVIFGVILSTLRRREQLERLIHLAILASLPVALYGLIQRFGLDPLPWGGNVVRRVASNMGNSIFVAAYLIMIVPLTLRNLLSNLFSVVRDEDTWVKLPFIVGCALAIVLQAVAWLSISYVAGILIGALFTLLMGVFALVIHKPLLKFAWIAAHGVILVAQLACIFYTQSRGPWLGLLAGLFFFVLIFAFSQRIRWLQWTSITLALAGGLFLGVLNMPNTPLAAIKQLPYIGRLGRLLETEQGTGKVRVLIWEGATELIGWHEPIGLPGQEDKLNALRPLIGYGPESMIVAYNPFYPPDLAHYERRNASPDRSHNETFDALIQTGLIGFLVYFSFYIVLFYHSLKWLGLLENQRHRNTYLGLTIGGALLGVLGPLALEGSLRYAGVGAPFGFTIGLVLYLILSSFIVPHQNGSLSERQLLLMALLSAILAHFIEIHFGIAIASTRTYFWTYAAILVAVGLRWVSLEIAEPELPVVPVSSEASTRRKRSRRPETPRKAPPDQTAKAWRWSGAVAWALLAALVLVTLAYDFITNQQGLANSAKIVANALTVLIVNDAPTSSPALLWLFLFTWFVGGLFALSQTPAARAEDDKPLARHLTTLAIYVGITLAAFLAFALPHASRIQPGADVALAIGPYYGAALALLFIVALALWRETPLPTLALRPATRWVQAAMVPLSLAICAVLIVNLNLGMVKADIYYKQAKFYDQAQNWDIAIRLYQEAISYARDQDYYYLFLGRAYLEKATAIANAEQRAPWLERAQQTLEGARQLNPLNTDHSANLARLQRTIAEMTDDPAEREQALSRSLQYYEDATALSPNTPKLYNEWGLIHAMRGDLETALTKFQKSLALDQQYEETHLYLGNYYLNQQRYEDAEDAYLKALKIKPDLVQAHSALGYVYSKQGRLEEAVSENLQVLAISPADYASHKNLAILYQQLGRYAESLAEAKAALENAPQEERSALESFIAQMESQLKSSGAN